MSSTFVIARLGPALAAMMLALAMPAVTQASDFADGNAGGPDFWQVANVPPGDLLNIRSRPSARASVVARLRNGTILRNRGCRVSGGTRWCRVERKNGSSAGWAAGRFLIEAGG